jgi:hypothetical protein
MTNYDSSNRCTARGTTVGRQARVVGVCAAAAAIGAVGLWLSALAHVRDTKSAAVALTSTDPQTYLTGPGLLPDAQYPAYNDLSFLDGDAQLATSELDKAPTPLGTLLITLNNDFWDFTQVGYLTDGSTADAGTVLPDSGVGTITHIAGVTPQADETASQLLSQTQAEGNLITENTTAIHNEVVTLDRGGPVGTDIGYEFGPVNDDTDFQTEINNALAALQPLTSADEHNPILIYDLSSLLNSENSMNDDLVNLDTSIMGDQINQITADNAALAQNGGAIFDAAQNIVSYFPFEQLLQQFGL